MHKHNVQPQRLFDEQRPTGNDQNYIMLRLGSKFGLGRVSVCVTNARTSGYRMKWNGSNMWVFPNL